jgi:hypothetical protein
MMRIAFLGAVAALGGACLQVSSSASVVDTRSLVALMTVNAGASGLTVAGASLTSVDNPTEFIELSSGDSLTASTGNQSQVMAKVELMGAVSYVASFSGAATADAAYQIALTRASGGSAPSSSCSLPAPFDAALATPTTTFSRANDAIPLTITGAGGSDTTSVAYTGNCVSAGVVYVSNDSMLQVLSGTIKTALGSPSNASCQVTLLVERSRDGTVDPALALNSKMTCSQTRPLTITSVP